jgi:hypothetical protein
MIRAKKLVLRGGKTEKGTNGCTGFISRTYRVLFGLVATAGMGWPGASSFTRPPEVAIRAARFAALAAWYLAFANDSFDCSLVADCFFVVFATDRLRGNG